jgi:hypothetical protein
MHIGVITDIIRCIINIVITIVSTAEVEELILDKITLEWDYPIDYNEDHIFF